MYSFAFPIRFLLFLIITFFIPLFSTGQQLSDTGDFRLKLELSRGLFRDFYQLILKKEGSDAINNQDAIKLGEGFIVLAALAAGNMKLAIDERQAGIGSTLIDLYIKGWASGCYSLKFSLDPSLFNAYTLKLVDEHLQRSRIITARDSVYIFSINTDSAQTFGSSRFKLLVEPAKIAQAGQSSSLTDIVVYPNPFHANLYISTHQYNRPLIVKIRDFMGQMLVNRRLSASDTNSELSTQYFAPGLYLIELFDQKTGVLLKSQKIVKQ